MRSDASGHPNLSQQQIEATIGEVAAELRSWGGVAVVGAGLSVLSGMPLSIGLTALVWYALDSDPPARREVAQQLGQPDIAAKVLIGDDPNRLVRAYAAIRTHPTARQAFQYGFARRNDERKDRPSTAHEGLARLFHAGHVELVISENWDTLFECAYERLYGRKLVADEQFLFKPHGDAARPELPWVLPDEHGRIPESLERRLKQFTADRPRMLLIAGYAEADEEVAKKLIQPLSARWRVARIGPDAQGQLSIALPADVAIPKLVATVDPRPMPSPWVPVRFGQQHDLGPALSGEGLSASDIDALPPFPEAASLITQLRTSHRASLSGDSGCGKSGTAYRVAQHFHNQGFEILRLTDASAILRDLQAPLEAQRFPTFALIDDGHRLEPWLLTELMNIANPSRLMLAVLTATQPVGRNEIRIDSNRAVSIIAAALLRDRARTLALVHALDNHVHDGYGGEILETRIEHAAEQASPWQFSFVLTGGWRRAARHLVNAYAANRADLLLFAISTYQIISEDDGPQHDALVRAAIAFGFDATWVERGLRDLFGLRLITSVEQPKCVHLRHAIVVLKTAFGNPNDPLMPRVLIFLDRVLGDPKRPLRGCYWLLDALRFADWLWGKRGEVLSDGTRSILVSRSFGAETSYDRSLACYLLSIIDDFVPDWAGTLNAHVNDLSRFIREADGMSGWGLARLLNNIDRDHHTVTNMALAQVDPAQFAIKIEETPVEMLAGFAELLERLAYVGRDSFAPTLRATWSSKHVRKLAMEAAARNTYAFGEFVKAVNHIDKELAFAIVDENAELLAAAFGAKPIETYENLSDVLWFVLSFDMGLGVVPRPSAAQRKVGRRICKSLEVASCARAIEAGRLGQLERWARLLYFVKRADPIRGRKVYRELSFEKIDKWLAPFWANPPSELEHFVLTASCDQNHEPARSWIAQHQADLRRIPPRFAIVAPEAVTNAIRAGGDFAYNAELGLSWNDFIIGLVFVARVDKEVAATSIRGHIDVFVKSLTTHQANLYEKIDKLLPVLEEIAPGIERDIFASIDPELATKHWPQLLKGKPAERRAANYLLRRAAKYAGPLSEPATKLVSRAAGKRRSTDIS